MAREMKDSGVAWGGEMPASWGAHKVGTCFTMGSGTTPPTNEQHWYIGSIPWVQTSELRENVIFETSKSISDSALRKFSALRRYKAGSVLVAMYGATIGRVGMLGINATTNQACCVLSERVGVSANFAFWWFQEMRNDLIERGNGGGQPNISQSVIASLRIFAPNKTEQLAIADYIDQQTALIDQRLSTLEEKKTVLAELRKATIHEAVTKGLNKNAPMKESGIAWIGEIPAHWTRLRIKDVCRAYDGMLAEESNLYVGLEHIQPWMGKYQAEDRSEAEATTGQLIAAGVMCFSKLRPYLAKAFVANEMLFVTTELLTFVPRRTVVDADFLTLYVLTYGFIAEVNDAVAGTKMPRVDWQTFTTRTIHLPPLTEQLAIAKHLDQQTHQIDAQLATLDEQAQVLKALRKAIIHEAVTGKIDLSGVVSGKEKR